MPVSICPIITPSASACASCLVNRDATQQTTHVLSLASMSRMPSAPVPTMPVPICPIITPSASACASCLVNQDATQTFASEVQSTTQILWELVYFQVQPVQPPPRATHVPYRASTLPMPSVPVLALIRVFAQLLHPAPRFALRAWRSRTPARASPPMTGPSSVQSTRLVLQQARLSSRRARLR
jgi:hypothetical protein